MDKKTAVAVIVGSDSDLPVIEETTKVLEKLSISYSVSVASAHRTPELLKNIINASVKNGVKVFIAAAGMSAALPGVVASETILPVIGVPMEGKHLASQDSLFSVSQMPPGIPVGCVAVGKAGAVNAAVLAAEILAVSDFKIAKKLLQYRENMRNEITLKHNKLQNMGIKKYLEEKNGK